MLYACPHRGRTFSRRPIEDACTRAEVDGHFAKCGPRVRVPFDRLVGAASSCGEVQVSALASMVALNAPKMTGGGAAQRRALKVWLVLPGVREHRTLARRREMGEIRISHLLLPRAEGDFAGGFEGLIRGARELAAGV